MKREVNVLSKSCYVLFVLVLISSGILSACCCAQAYFSKELLDYVTASEYERIKGAALFLMVSTLLLVVAELFRKLLSTEYERRVTNSLQAKLMSGILSMNFAEYEKQNQDEYLSIFNNELKSVVSDYYMELLEFLYSVLSTVFLSAFLFRLQPVIAVVVIVSNIIPMIIPLFFAKGLQTRKTDYLRSIQRYNMRLGDGIKGFFLLKVHKRRDAYQDIMEGAGKEATGKKADYQNLNSICEIIIGFFAYASYLCIIIGGVVLIYYGKLTAGGLLAAITVSDMLASPVTNIAYQANTINAIRGVKKELFEKYLQIRPQEEKLNLKEPVSEIAIKDLCFSYGEKKILDNLNVTFERGKKYLICGDNGSGKSTFLKVLAKQSDYAGSVLVNGMELREINADSYYEQMGFAMQKAFLFNDSLENNITLFQPDNKKDIHAILAMCQAKTLLEKQKEAAEYHDGKGNLSGGEGQKIAIARLRYDEKQFQIWDEALSAFDQTSSYQIEKDILCDPNITLIHVQHMIKEELLPYYDEILYLENGKLVRRNN